MSYIDAQNLTASQVLERLSLWRGTGLEVRVSDEVRNVLGPLLDLTPVPRPFVEIQQEHIKKLQQSIRDYVDQYLPPTEREGLASIASGLAEKVAFGGTLTETEQTVALALMFARAWTNAAMALGGEVAVQCNACTTVEQLQAVTVDLASLGPPPHVTAGEVALMLRGV